jgi:predicted  nucleic acid-binding Zn-ribbon protein
MERLRSDIGDEDVRRTLETKFENSFKQVQELERQLADVNLAKDKARSGMSHEDVRRQTHALQARNKRLEKEVDEIFLARRKTEDEVAKLHLEMRKMHQGFEYQKLLSEIESIHEEGRVEEEKIGQLFHRMKAIESSSPLVGQVSSFSTPNELIHMGDAPLQNEIKDLITEQRELRSRLRALKGGAAIELLDRMEEIDTLLRNTSDEKAQLENDLLSLTSAIESLREEISAAEMLSKCHLPSRNEVQLMQEVRVTIIKLQAFQL